MSHGFLIVNADDWGRDERTTDMIHECAALGAVTAVSAMVFMEDSGRAASMARDRGIEAGLHLNLTTPFTQRGLPAPLIEQQLEVRRYLRSHRFAPYVFNPWLRSAFAGLVAAQIDEFRRLYGADPVRIDGHHHMHLSANVLLDGLLPHGVLVRRNFCFEAGEKGRLNRWYRRTVDRALARRFSLTDLFFSIQPLRSSQRIRRICALARSASVELETHPAQPDEHRFLLDGGLFSHADGVRLAPPSALQQSSEHVH